MAMARISWCTERDTNNEKRYKSNCTANTNLSCVRIDLERVADVPASHSIDQIAGGSNFRRGRAQFRDHPTLWNVFR